MLNWWRAHAHNCGKKVGLKKLLLHHKCTIFSLEHTVGHTGNLLVSKMKFKMSNFSMKLSTNFAIVLKWYLLHAGKCKGQNVAEMHFWTDIWAKSHIMYIGTSREKRKKREKSFFIYICVYIETFHKLCSEMIFTSCGKM